MSDVIVDSSVAVKWVLREPDTADAWRVFDDATAQGDFVIVLDLAMVEVGQAIWKRHHRRLISADEARDALRTLLGLSLYIERAQPLFPLALEIALKYDRAFYDALFVALVQQSKLPGVTADEPLVQAVQTDFPQIKLLRDW